jgi:hypothetical protein
LAARLLLEKVVLFVFFLLSMIIYQQEGWTNSKPNHVTVHGGPSGKPLLNHQQEEDTMVPSMFTSGIN